MLDRDLAKLYCVPTKVFNQAVRRNIERFPNDFMFKSTLHEAQNLRSQIVTSSLWGGQRWEPHIFTELGVAMLSSVLRSPCAIAVNIQIMRTFSRLREMLGENVDLRMKLEEIDLLPNNLMPAKRHIRLQVTFENLEIALLFLRFSQAPFARI